jgi:hypothetical protein
MDDINKSMMRESSPPPRVYTPATDTTLAAAGRLLMQRLGRSFDRNLVLKLGISFVKKTYACILRCMEKSV